jgi:hypothetical protein
MRTPFLLLCLALLAGACAQESPQEPRPAGRVEPEPVRKPRPPQAEASLVSTGRLAYTGGSELRCVMHGETGLQLSFRTGDLDLPVMVVRIADYHGEGRYRGDLFLTGRNGGGALLGSTGSVELQVDAPGPLNARGVQILGGTFEGRYAGTAGQGEVRGRFARCPFRPAGTGAPLPQLAEAPGQPGMPPQPATGP